MGIYWEIRRGAIRCGIQEGWHDPIRTIYKGVMPELYQTAPRQLLRDDRHRDAPDFELLSRRIDDS